MTEQIPSSASVGSHAVTASINFQYQDPGTLSWVTPTTSPLVIQGSINVDANPTGLALLGFIIIGVIVALVVVVVGLVFLLRRRRRAGPPAPTMPSNPPSPQVGPPAQ